MKRIPSASSLRRAMPLALIVALALTLASCAPSKQYGCPNHLQSSSLSLR